MSNLAKAAEKASDGTESYADFGNSIANEYLLTLKYVHDIKGKNVGSQIV